MRERRCAAPCKQFRPLLRRYLFNASITPSQAAPPKLKFFFIARRKIERQIMLLGVIGRCPSNKVSYSKWRCHRKRYALPVLRACIARLGGVCIDPINSSLNSGENESHISISRPLKLRRPSRGAFVVRPNHHLSMPRLNRARKPLIILKMSAVRK